MDNKTTQFMYGLAVELINSRMLPEETPRAVFYELVIALAAMSKANPEALNGAMPNHWGSIAGDLVGSMGAIKPAIDNVLDTVYADKTKLAGLV